MNGKTHLLLSLVIAMIFIKIFPSVFSSVFMKFLFAIGLIIGTAFPDLDHRVGAFQHRGITHTIYLPTITLILAFLISPAFSFLIAFSMGYFSHLLGDMITLHGIHPIYPVRYRISWGIKSGGIVERIIFILLVLVVIFFI